MVTNSRLAQFARLYEYYRVHSMTFHFMASQPATTTGSVVAYFDYDSEDPLVASGDANIEGAFGHQVNHAAKVYESFNLVVGPDPSRLHREKWTQPRTATSDDADLDFGALVVLAMDEFSVAPPASLYNIYVTYDVELYGPNYEPATAATISLERKVIPGDQVKSAGGGSVPTGLPLAHDFVTGARDSAANLRKTMDELRGMAGELGDVVDTAKAGIKMASDMRSVSQVYGVNTASKASQFLLTPGKYFATITFSICDAAGKLDLASGNIFRNAGAGRWGVDYMVAIWSPESGSPDVSRPCVTQPFFYYNVGTTELPSIGVGAKDMNYIAEFTVLKNAWVGFGIKSGNSTAGSLTAFNVAYLRTTCVIRQDSAFSIGEYWPATAAANTDGDLAPYPYSTDGVVACQFDDRSFVEPNAAGASADAAPMLVPAGDKNATMLHRELQGDDEDEYDDVRSQHSASVGNRRLRK